MSNLRGTFSHMGVRMEGLESKRHLNFVARKQDDGTFVFFRDHGIRNLVVRSNPKHRIFDLNAHS